MRVSLLLMAAKKRNPAVEIVHVLFMDLVGSTEVRTDVQPELIDLLEGIVKRTSEYSYAKKTQNVVPLPTGDGIALVFLKDAAAPARCAREILTAIKGNTNLRVRMGINSGEVVRRRDIRRNVNFNGAGINFAQRAMDCGGADQILVTEAAWNILENTRSWAEYFEPLGRYAIKHGKKRHLYRLTESAVDQWFRIEAGPFRMGSQKEDDEEAQEDESPVHEVQLNAFKIGRFPVTVQQYRAFVESPGFGESQVPQDWEEQKLNPGWPVVGVSWHEADAYCRWGLGRWAVTHRSGVGAVGARSERQKVSLGQPSTGSQSRQLCWRSQTANASGCLSTRRDA